MDPFGTNNPGYEFFQFTDAEAEVLSGIAALGDPNADRLLFWDDSAGSYAYLTAGSGLSISGTTISVTGATLSDGDYGDITASSSGTVLTIDNGAVTLAKTSAGVQASLALADSALQSGDNVSALTNDANYYAAGGTDVALADGGTGASLADPGADHIMFWDDSAGVVTWLTVGAGLAITDTTIAATAAAPAWGEITGTLSNQTDLQTALDAKIEDLSTFDTADLAEGTNLYFTDERAQDAVGGIFVDSSEIDFTYNDATPSITASIVAGSIDETKLDASVNASLDLADSAVQDLADLGITATATELNYVDGVTSAIQTQLDAKLANVSEDTSPELGGDLNAGANTIYFTETDNGNSSTADTIDWGASNKQKSTLTGNVTFTFTAPAGPCNLILKLVQDATGSRTVTWPASVKWSGGTAPTLTTTASRIDIISFYYDGTNYYGSYVLNFTA